VGPRLEKAKRNIWIHKAKALIIFKETDKKPEFPLSFTSLKNMLFDGYSLLTTKESIHEMKKEIAAIEDLVRDVEKHLQDIFNIKDPSLLENLNEILFDSIDLKEEIIDYKAQLNVSSDYKASLETVVKDLGKKEDSEILAIVKSKEHLPLEKRL